MRFGYDETTLDHETGAIHPESPERVEAIVDELDGSGGADVTPTSPATTATVGTVHEPEYLEDLADFCAAGGGQWCRDTWGNADTMAAALASAGTATWAVDRALEHPSVERSPFALCRPPGHHAVADDAMGFCFLNNAAIAAERALTSSAVDRVAILDWDVHHGNGVQDAFYDRGDVLYASIHQRGLFPETGTIDEAGVDAGAGTTINVPVPGGAGDPEYVAAVETAIGPRIEAFDPDVVLVCAGFDAKADDHTSRTTLSDDGVAMLTARVRDLAVRTDSAVAFLLEGGYQVEALSTGVRTVQETMCGRDPPACPGTASREAIRVIDAARAGGAGA